MKHIKLQTSKKGLRIKNTAALLFNPVCDDDFYIELTNANHISWIKEIAEVTLSSALARGTGISGRSAELLEEKVLKSRFKGSLLEENLAQSSTVSQIWAAGNVIPINKFYLMEFFKTDSTVLCMASSDVHFPV